KRLQQFGLLFGEACAIPSPEVNHADAATLAEQRRDDEGGAHGCIPLSPRGLPLVCGAIQSAAFSHGSPGPAALWQGYPPAREWGGAVVGEHADRVGLHHADAGIDAAADADRGAGN